MSNSEPICIQRFPKGQKRTFFFYLKSLVLRFSILKNRNIQNRKNSQKSKKHFICLKSFFSKFPLLLIGISEIAKNIFIGNSYVGGTAAPDDKGDQIWFPPKILVPIPIRNDVVRIEFVNYHPFVPIIKGRSSSLKIANELFRSLALVKIKREIGNTCWKHKIPENLIWILGHDVAGTATPYCHGDGNASFKSFRSEQMNETNVLSRHFFSN